MAEIPIILWDQVKYYFLDAYKNNATADEK